MKQMEIRDYDGIPPFRVRRTAGKKRSGCFSSVHSVLRMIIYLAGILAIANLILSWLVPDVFPDEFLNEMTSPPESFQRSTTPTSLTYRTFLQNFGDVQVLNDETYGDCLRTGGQIRHCEHDEFIVHEPLIHPALIAHPFPRKVLIAGGADGALIREALKHFLLTKIDVVGFDKKMSALTKKHLPKSYSYDDILSRVEIHETPLLDFLVASKERYDAIIVDFASGNGNIPTLATESEWSDFVQLAKTRLSKGGIVSTRTGEASMEQGNFWDSHKAMTGKFKHSHIYTQHQPSNAITWGYHLSFDTDAFADPRSLAPSYVDVLLARRMPEGTQHYDGVSHLNMFNIPLWMRLKAERFAVNADFPVSHAPHKEGHIDRLHPVHIRGETVQREFFGCDPEVLEDVAELEAAMREGLTKYAHAKIIGIKTDVFTTYQNLTGLDVEFDEQANDESKPVHIVVYLALAEGSVVLHSYPAFNYAVAIFTNFNSWVVPNELFGSLFEKLGSARTVGSSISIGPPNPIQSPTAFGPNVNYLDYVVSYEETDALEVHRSPTAGNGQFATRNIKKGSLIYYGPIEQYLVHEDEMAVSPRWLQDYYNHMGENAEKSIWVAPGSFDEDNSYFTNHNCDPNLVYAGYDIMKARRDIPKGAELTFDYATVDAVKEDFKCNCGSPKCRGKVTSDDWKNDTYVAELGVKHFWPHVQKKILLEQRTRNHKV